LQPRPAAGMPGNLWRPVHGCEPHRRGTRPGLRRVL